MTQATTYRNSELLAQLAAGDENAFAVFVKGHWRNIFGQALTYLKSAERAEEVSQDVFMKIWKNRQELPSLENVEGYLYVVCRNTVLNELRKLLRTTEQLPATDAVEEALQPHKQLEYREYHARVMNLIEQLPEKRRQVFKMSRLEGKSHEEIAAALGISKDTVAQYIVKAINFLKTELLEPRTDLLLIALLLDLAL